VFYHQKSCGKSGPVTELATTQATKSRYLTEPTLSCPPGPCLTLSIFISRTAGTVYRRWKTYRRVGLNSSVSGASQNDDKLLPPPGSARTRLGRSVNTWGERMSKAETNRLGLKLEVKLIPTSSSGSSGTFRVGSGVGWKRPQFGNR